MRESIIFYFEDHIDLLIEELNLYPDEQSVWALADGIKNCPGNLVYHLVGNLNHFIGHGIGNTGNERDRPLEFSIKDVPRSELIQDLQATKVMIREVLSEADLEADYPEELFERPGSFGHFLLKLATHLPYHIG
ncbi:MAG: DinB superfamily protein [Bacteroidota bacterium]